MKLVDSGPSESSEAFAHAVKDAPTRGIRTTVMFYGEEAEILNCLVVAPVCRGLDWSSGYKNGEPYAEVTVTSTIEAHDLHRAGAQAGNLGFTAKARHAFCARMLEAAESMLQHEKLRNERSNG